MTEDITEIVVSVWVISELFGVTDRRIQQYSDEGMPKIGRGEYNLHDCVQWRLKKLQEENEMLANSGSSDMHKLKMKALEISNQERLAKLDVIVGKLVDRESVRIAWATETRNYVKAMKALVNKLSASLENVDNRIQRRTIIGNEVDYILNGLSELKIENDNFDDEEEFLKAIKDGE